MNEEWLASWKRQKLIRKKRVKHFPKLPTERKRGQLSMKQAEDMAWNEMVRWKGIPRLDEFKEE